MSTGGGSGSGPVRRTRQAKARSRASPPGPVTRPSTNCTRRPERSMSVSTRSGTTGISPMMSMVRRTTHQRSPSRASRARAISAAGRPGVQGLVGPGAAGGLGGDEQVTVTVEEGVGHGPILRRARRAGGGQRGPAAR